MLRSPLSPEGGFSALPTSNRIAYPRSLASKTLRPSPSAAGPKRSSLQSRREGKQTRTHTSNWSAAKGDDKGSGRGPLPMLGNTSRPMGNEEPGYATYSYVLAGRDDTDRKSAALYTALVRAILGSTVKASVITQKIIPRSALNLFLIPVIEANGSGRGKPNYELSKLFLAALSTVLPIDLSRPGPYIITLHYSLSARDIDDTVDPLYVDLSGTHVKVIPEIVRTHKGIVMKEHLDSIARLKSLRLSLLNIALLTEDSIEFAKVAYARI